MSTKTMLILAVAAVVAYFMFVKKGAAGNVGAPGTRGVAGAAKPSVAQQVGQAAFGIAQTQLNNIFGGSSTPPGNVA